MKQSVPPTPLVLVVLAIVVIAASAWGLTQPVSMSIGTPVDLAVSDNAERGTNSSAVQLFVPPPASANIRDIQGRSPFVEDRSAYSRVVARPRPAAPTYQPELVGIFGKGDSRSAMIIWKPGDQTTSHTVGGATPWGTVHAMTSGEVQFSAGEETKILRLFE